MDQFNLSVIYLGLFSYIGYVLRSVPLMIFEFIWMRFAFSVSTTSNDKESYYTINEWLLSLNKKVLKNNINVKEEYSRIGSSSKHSINYGKFIFVHNNSVVIVHKTEITSTFNHLDKIEVIVIGGKNSKENVMKQIKPAAKKDSINVFPLPEIWDKFVVRKKSFDDVFIKDKNLIISHLERWKNLNEFSRTHGMIHKTGILLYGPPGTGKSTTARAIASYLDYDLHVINVNSYKEEDKLISRIINIPANSVVLFEDIDCITSSRENENMNPMEKRQLGTLLNIIDGTMSPENVVFVATTNNIDSLDPALIREGRFDLKINVSNIEMEEAKDMCYRFGVDLYVVARNESFPISPVRLMNKILSYAKTGS